MTVRQKEPPSMIRSLMEPSPTLEWEMERKDGKGNVTIYPFRQKVLRPAENIGLLSNAQKSAKGKELKGYGDIYREEQACELIARCTLKAEAVTDPQGREYFPHYFTSAQQVKESLTESECAQLVNCYHITRAHFDMEPYEEAETEALIDGLANEMTAPFFLKRVQSPDYPLLICALARLAHSWRQYLPPTHPSSASFSESDSETTDSDTTGFSELPSALSKEQDKPPTTELLNPNSARNVIRDRKKTKTKTK